MPGQQTNFNTHVNESINSAAHIRRNSLESQEIQATRGQLLLCDADGAAHDVVNGPEQLEITHVLQALLTDRPICTGAGTSLNNSFELHKGTLQINPALSSERQSEVYGRLNPAPFPGDAGRLHKSPSQQLFVDGSFLLHNIYDGRLEFGAAQFTEISLRVQLAGGFLIRLTLNAGAPVRLIQFRSIFFLGLRVSGKCDCFF